MKTNKPVNKMELAKAVYAFCLQKPHFDTRDYHSTSAYRSDYNRYKRPADFNRSFGVSGIYEILKPLSDERIIVNVAPRLEIVDTETGYKVYYNAGQYYPTEYQWGVKNTLDSWIDAHLVANGLPLNELMSMETIGTNSKYGELKYDAEKAIYFSMKDDSYYQTVIMMINGKEHKRTFYMGGVQ